LGDLKRRCYSQIRGISCSSTFDIIIRLEVPGVAALLRSLVRFKQKLRSQIRGMSCSSNFDIIVRLEVPGYSSFI
jgi:hypothetical protein